MPGKRLFLGIVSLIVASTLSFAQETIDYQVLINNTAVVLDSPLIKEKGVLYCPVLDLRDPLDFGLAYQPKDAYYTLFFRKLGVKGIVIPNSAEIWFDRTQHFFSEKTLFYNNQLYIPIREFFNVLGYSVHLSGKALHIKGSMTRTDRGKDPANRRYTPPVDNYRLPVFEKEFPLYLVYGQIKRSLGNRFFYDSEKLFVNIDSFLSALNYNLSRDGQVVKIYRGKKEFLFTRGESVVAITTANGKKYNRFLGDCIRFRGNLVYFSLESFLNLFEFYAEWRPRERSIELLSPITNIEYHKADLGGVLNIYSPHQLDYDNLYASVWAQQVVFDVLDSTSVMGQGFMRFNAYFLDSCSIHRENGNRTRFYLNMAQDAGARIEKTSFGLRVHFQPVVNQIDEYYKGTKHVVRISASLPIKYKYWTEKKRPRLIIDIPDSYSKLEPIISAYNPSYKRIRTAQFSYDPPITRVVFDLFPGSNFVVKAHGKNAIDIEFSIPTIRPKWDPAMKGLQSRVIVIDPGHGGGDPGAIGLDRAYEKTYNLDVAKRLKRKLQDVGAIVILVRNEDQNPSLERRATIANQNRADAFISIHFNSFFNQAPKGTASFYYKSKDKPLAKALHAELVRELRLKNKGVKFNNLYVLTHSVVPAALVEPAFITNPREARLLKNPRFRQRIADALFVGLENYFK